MGAIKRAFANNITTSGNLLTLDAANLTGTLPAISGASLTGIESGLTVADQWRLTAAIPGPDAVITTSNIERIDTNMQGNLGSGMTYSSGVFTFPTTGFYLVMFKAATSNTAGDETQFKLQLEATANNSSYDVIASVRTSARPEHNNQSAMGATILDVSDTANRKVRFSTQSHQANTNLDGSTSDNTTTFTFIRLGAT